MSKTNIPFLKEVILVLSTAIATTFCNQLFFEHNIVKQKSIEMQAEYIKYQSRISHNLNLLMDASELIQYEFRAPSAERNIQVKVDKFGNVVKRDTLVSSNVEYVTFSIKAPGFIFNDDKYDNLLEALEEIESLQDYLPINLSEKVQDLFQYLEEHPIPKKENRINEVINDWGQDSVYLPYLKIIRQISQINTSLKDKFNK